MNLSRMTTTLALALAALGPCGCGSGEDDGTPDAGDAGDDWPFPIADIDVQWSPCSLYDGADDGRAECATVEMPLFWGDGDDDRTFEVAAKRLLWDGDADLQLWLLDGGPGGAGTIDFPALMEFFQQLYPHGVDVYTLDHRGTGYSGRLSCPAAEAPDSADGEQISVSETLGCIPYLEETLGDALDAITTSASSIDLAALIEASRDEHERVIVWGGSYGTYWAQRYVQIFPDQADGILIESIFPADGTFVFDDYLINDVAHEVLDLCAADGACSAKLGDDPWALLGDVLGRMREGHCTTPILSPDLVRVLFAYSLYSPQLAALIPAAVYRLDRCEPEDQAAVEGLYQFLFGEGGTWDIKSYSVLLQHHITFSEMWDHPDLAEQSVEDVIADTYESVYVGKLSLDAKNYLRGYWPLYEDEVYDDGFADTGLPILMLQGRLDGATPAAKAAPLAGIYSGAQQTYLEFAYACHGVAGDTPYGDGRDCGIDIWLQFLEDPTAPLDTSCMDELDPLDFNSGAVAAAVFGTADPYENLAEAPAVDDRYPRSPSPEAAALRARLRARLRLFR